MCKQPGNITLDEQRWCAAYLNYLSAPFIPATSPHTIISRPLVYTAIFFLPRISDLFSFFFVNLSVRVTILWAPHSLYPLLPDPHPPFLGNSPSIALLTATHQPGCNLKSPSTAAIPKDRLSVQLPKPRQGLGISEQLWTSGRFSPTRQFQMDWRWKTLFLKDCFSGRQTDLGGVLMQLCFLPSWHGRANIWHA